MTNTDSGISRGYLVLVDISGFTSFVAGSELDHSKVILRDIFKLIIGRFSPRLTVAEIEGDAVFAFASDKQMPRGETLLEMIEATYIDFRDKQRSSQRMVTCTCTACQMSGQLDLKFITHFGDFILQDLTGKKKPLGSSVNLLHRLTKNRIFELTGWRGYALFTGPSLERMDVHPLNAHAQVESYEHLGEVETFSMNLDERYRELVSERYVAISPTEADVVISQEFPVTPDMLWEWLNYPEKKGKWMVGSDWHKEDRPRGRTGRGSTNHCSNSNATESILDWRPFSYYTVNLVRSPVNLTMTWRLEATTHGTQLTLCARFNGSLPRWMLRRICKFTVFKVMKFSENFARLTQLIEADTLTRDSERETRPEGTPSRRDPLGRGK